MTLKEAQKILLELNKPIQDRDYGENKANLFNYVLDADKEYFRQIYYHIFNLCNYKTPIKHKRTLDALKRNPLVSRITKTTLGYEIVTTYGSCAFWNAQKNYKTKKYPSYITFGKDFDNALFGVIDLHQNNPKSKPEVMVGLFHYPMEPEKAYPTAYATYETPNGTRFVLDVKLNMTIEEGLFKKLIGFTELERIDGETASYLFDITTKFVNSPAYDDNNEPSFGHAVLAPEEYFKYVYDVLNGDIPHNFPFGDVTNNSKICDNNPKKNNEPKID